MDLWNQLAGTSNFTTQIGQTDATNKHLDIEVFHIFLNWNKNLFNLFDFNN